MLELHSQGKRYDLLARMTVIALKEMDIIVGLILLST